MMKTPPSIQSAHKARNLLAALLTATVLQAAGTAQAATYECKDLTQVGVSKNISQLIRSNSRHFWGWSRTHAPKSDLKTYLASSGVVAGDPHLGNFSVVPVTFENGEQKLQFVNIDFDDAGIGPFALDFARMVIALKAENDEIKIKDIVDAYVKGLNGQAIAPASYVTSALATPLTTVNQKIDKYVDKKTKGDHFVLEAAELEEYKGALSKSEIQRLFPKGQVLDLASRPKERGGSADSERIWVLVRNENGLNRIFELKGYQEAGVASNQKQPDIKTWLNSIRGVFRPGQAASDYDLVEVRQGMIYWLREKKVDLFDADIALAPTIANHLGMKHGGQAQAKSYAARVSADPDAFREALKPLLKEYLELAKLALTGKCP